MRQACAGSASHNPRDRQETRVLIPKTRPFVKRARVLTVRTCALLARAGSTLETLDSRQVGSSAVRPGSAPQISVAWSRICVEVNTQSRDFGHVTPVLQQIYRCAQKSWERLGYTCARRRHTHYPRNQHAQDPTFFHIMHTTCMQRVSEYAFRRVLMYSGAAKKQRVRCRIWRRGRGPPKAHQREPQLLGARHSAPRQPRRTLGLPKTWDAP
jgi:hypothetical protein